MLDFFPLLIGVPNNKLMLQQLPQLNNGFFLLVMSIQTCDMVLVFQSCLTLCSPMDCSLPGSSAHGILQARTLEWDAIFYSRESSQLESNLCLLHLWLGRQILYYQRHISEKAMALHSSTLAWKIHGRRSLVGCRLWGRTESDTIKVTQQQQQAVFHCVYRQIYR